MIICTCLEIYLSVYIYLAKYTLAIDLYIEAVRLFCSFKHFYFVDLMLVSLFNIPLNKEKLSIYLYLLKINLVTCVSKNVLYCFQKWDRFLCYFDSRLLTMSSFMYIIISFIGKCNGNFYSFIASCAIFITYTLTRIFPNFDKTDICKWFVREFKWSSFSSAETTTYAYLLSFKKCQKCTLLGVLLRLYHSSANNIKR